MGAWSMARPAACGVLAPEAELPIVDHRMLHAEPHDYWRFSMPGLQTLEPETVPTFVELARDAAHPLERRGDAVASGREAEEAERAVGAGDGNRGGGCLQDAPDGVEGGVNPGELKRLGNTRGAPSEQDGPVAQ